VGGTPTNLALALVKEFAGDLRQARTINQLALCTGKAYANTHATATLLLDQGILTKEVVGHSHRCRLNLANDRTLLYLSLVELHKRDELLAHDTTGEVRALIERIDRSSAELGTLLAWKRPSGILLITSHVSESAIDAQRASAMIGMHVSLFPLAAFLHDPNMRMTIARDGTLLFGHALYTSLLREVRR
jgi:hypothetical protein